MPSSRFFTCRAQQIKLLLSDENLNRRDDNHTHTGPGMNRAWKDTFADAPFMDQNEGQARPHEKTTPDHPKLMRLTQRECAWTYFPMIQIDQYPLCRTTEPGEDHDRWMQQEQRKTMERRDESKNNHNGDTPDGDHCRRRIRWISKVRCAAGSIHRNVFCLWVLALWLSPNRQSQLDHIIDYMNQLGIRFSWIPPMKTLQFIDEPMKCFFDPHARLGRKINDLFPGRQIRKNIQNDAWDAA